MEARNALHRHSEHAEGVVLAELSLGCEREAGQVVERPQIGRPNSLLIPRAAIMCRMFVGMRNCLLQPLELHLA